MTPRPTRRSLLRGATVAGVGSLAGCTGILGSLRGGTFENGTVQWQTAVDGLPVGSFPVANENVYVGAWTSRNDERQLYALDRTDGSERWAAQLGSSTAGVTLNDGHLYAGTTDGDVYAVAADTGDVVWTANNQARISSVPAVVDGTVYLGDFDQRVFALDAATGEQQWDGSTNWRVEAGPRMVDGHLLVGGENLLFAFDPENGTPQWDALVAGEVFTPVAGHRGDAYVGAGVNVHRIEVESGEQVWRFDTDGFIRGSPAVTDDAVYTASLDGPLYAIDRDTGERRWTFEPDGNPQGPAVESGRIYVGDSEGTLYVLDAADGEPLWRVELDAGVSNVPTVIGETVYVGDRNSTVYAVTGPQ